MRCTRCSHPRFRRTRQPRRLFGGRGKERHGDTLLGPARGCVEGKGSCVGVPDGGQRKLRQRWIVHMSRNIKLLFRRIVVLPLSLGMIQRSLSG